MRLHFLPLLVTLIAARSAGAQLAAQPTRAFPLAVSPWVGINSFGHRWTVNSLEKASLGGSVGVGARLDAPLTRRIGVLLNTELAPRSAQVTRGEATQQSFAHTVAYRADLALGWRFKPSAPVFFAFGGGVVGSSKGPYPGFNKSSMAPEASATIGYDRGQGTVGASRWGFRFAFANYFVFPNPPGANDFVLPESAPSVKARSVAHDWTVQLGARYAIGTR